MVFGFGGGPIRRERDGSFTVRLSEPEQILLKSLLAQLRTLLKLEGGSEITDESGVRRLFPTAYPDRDDLEAEYQAMVHDDLLVRRLAAIDEVEATIVLPVARRGAARRPGCGPSTTCAWSWAPASTSPRTTSAPSTPTIPRRRARPPTSYLGWLLESTVVALTGSLPEPEDD